MQLQPTIQAVTFAVFRPCSPVVAGSRGPALPPSLYFPLHPVDARILDLDRRIRPVGDDLGEEVGLRQGDARILDAEIVEFVEE